MRRKTDLQRHEESVAWHSETLPLLREALWNLKTARKTCPSRPEVETLNNAARATEAAIKECERNLAVARRLAARERRG